MYYMPVFNNLIYLHIPKCGGTSIENHLAKTMANTTIDNVLWYGFVEGIEYSLQHLSYWEMLNMCGENLKNFRIFATIRNPYHRIL